jgi:hypothetical protein
MPVPNELWMRILEFRNARATRTEICDLMFVCKLWKVHYPIQVVIGSNVIHRLS